MKPNIGFFDSLIRLAIGMILIGTGLTYDVWWGFLGLCPLVTYLFKWSLIYHFLGISTFGHDANVFRTTSKE
jgi:hypothetical protein